MDDKEARIERLWSQIEAINNTSYPEGYFEVKVVMLQALRDRIQQIQQGFLIDKK